LLVALNEASVTVALAILAGVQLINLDATLSRKLLHARALVETTGAISLSTVGEAQRSAQRRYA